MKIEVSLTRWSYVAQFMGVYGMVIILYMLLEKKFITGQLIGQMKDTQLFLVLLVVVLIAVIFIAGFWRRGMMSDGTLWEAQTALYFRGFCRPYCAVL